MLDSLISRLPLGYFGLFLSTLIGLLIAISFFTIAERKILALIQRRKGPNIVGVFGLLQAIADGLKLCVKEVIFLNKSNPFLFIFAPSLALFFTFLSWMFIPFSLAGTFVISKYSLLVIFAISSLNIYTVILAGWASNSRYAFLGAIRSSAQMISYEIAIAFVLLPCIFCTQSMNLIEIVSKQQSVWLIWALFPLFLIFYICALAETNRTPFDLVEAEAELVGGFNTEYSSLIFAFFFLSEYGNILLINALCAVLFFGGWFPDYTWNIMGMKLFLGSWALILKTMVGCTFFVFIRGNLPRYRYDQLMFIGWHYYLPFTFGYFIFAIGVLKMLGFSI